MTAKEAISILMLSPIYFKIPPIERIKLIRDFCELYNEVAVDYALKPRA